MSTVVLQVGQCGNQLGGEWWRLVQADASASRSFIDSDGKARCVLIDSEPKVIQGLLKGPGGDLFRPGNVAYEQSGRGNNWALGYYKSGTGSRRRGRGRAAGMWTRKVLPRGPAMPRPADQDARTRGRAERAVAGGRAMAALRREAERCDWYQGCVLLHSIGGGTGAGVGSRLVEAVREEYPPNYITAVSVAPSSRRANRRDPTQSYNALLTIAWLQRRAPGAGAREAGPQGGGGAWGGRASPRGTERHVAGCLAGILYPRGRGRGPVRPYDAGDLVATLCRCSAKFLEARASAAALAPSTSCSSGTRGTSAAAPAALVSLSTQLLVRGDAACTAPPALAAGPGLARATPATAARRGRDGARARLLHAYPSVPGTLSLRPGRAAG
eukprot:tig00020610_g11942.t1